MRPQGILIAAYVFPLGLLVQYAAPWFVRQEHRVLIVTGAIVALGLCWTFEYGTEVEIATVSGSRL